MEAQGCEFPKQSMPDLFIAAMGEKAQMKAVEIASDMRAESFTCLYDVNGRGLRAQMKYANKLGAKYIVVLGDEETQSGIAKLKNMESGEETEIALQTFVSGFYSVSLEKELDDLKINGEEFDFNSLFGVENKN